MADARQPPQARVAHSGKAFRRRVERTEPLAFSADETCDVGAEAGSPVTADYTTPRGRFTGAVNWVEIAVDGDAADLNQ